MTLQQSKDQAAQERGYDDFYDATGSVFDDLEYDNIINRAIEIYGNSQWNAAIDAAAGSAECYADEGGYTGFIDEQSILKLKR